MTCTVPTLRKYAHLIANHTNFRGAYAAAGDCTFGRRREIVNSFGAQVKTATLPYLVIEDRDLLRRLFDKIFGYEATEVNRYDNIESPWTEGDHVVIAANIGLPYDSPHGDDAEPPCPVSTPTENPTMSIELQTLTMLNGKDITTMKDGEIYSLIASEEAAIAKLENIQTKPKRLVKEIERRRAGITTLVVYLDQKDS